MCWPPALQQRLRVSSVCLLALRRRRGQQGTRAHLVCGASAVPHTHQPAALQWVVSDRHQHLRGFCQLVGLLTACPPPTHPMLVSARRRMRDDLQHMRDKTVELELKMDRVSRHNSALLLPCSD